MLWGGLRLRREAPAHETQAAAPSSVSSAAPVRSDLEITWDPGSTLTAKAGLLKIQDGGVNHQMSLNPDELRFGRVLYSPTTDNIKVAMKALEIDGSIIEVAASTRAPSLAPIVPVAGTPDPTPVAPAEPALPKPDQKAGVDRLLVSVPVAGQDRGRSPAAPNVHAPDRSSHYGKRARGSGSAACRSVGARLSRSALNTGVARQSSRSAATGRLDLTGGLPTWPHPRAGSSGPARSSAAV